MEIKQKTVEHHFDNLSKDYDWGKKKNWYYDSFIKDLVRLKILPKMKVLEVGCATGEILNATQPEYGVGLDISPEMIDIAKKKFEHLNFEVSTIEDLDLKEKFDYIIMIDVIEHLQDPWTTITEFKRVSDAYTKIFISSLNPSLEVILSLAEKLRIKMPEGPHKFITMKSLKSYFEHNGFEVLESGQRMIVPFYIPLFSNLMNSFVHKIPILKNLCLIQYVIVCPKG